MEQKQTHSFAIQNILPVALATRAGETGGTGAPVPPSPRIFISWDGPRGTRYFINWALLTDIVLFFRRFAIFTYTLWALLALGALFRKGPKVWSPHLGTHFSRPACDIATDRD